MKIIKRLICVLIAVSMIPGLFSCAAYDSDNEKVLKLAYSYLESMAVVDVNNAFSMTDASGYELAQINDYVNTNPDMWGDRYHEICELIRNTITYTVNDSSVKSSVKDGTASVDAVFSMVDYDTIYHNVIGTGGGYNEYIETLADPDALRCDIPLTIEMVMVNEDWKISDTDLKNTYEMYSFYGITYGYEFISPYDSLLDCDMWFHADDDLYVNAENIVLGLVPVNEGINSTYLYSYEFYRNGVLIFTSDLCEGTGSMLRCGYGPEYDENAPLGSNGCLDRGQYRCVVYDYLGDILADSTCTVKNNADPATPDLVDHIEWFYSDDGTYTHVDTLELGIVPKEGDAQVIIWEFRYEYYFNDELIYSSPWCRDQGFWIESCYGSWVDPEAQLDENGYLIPGIYRCIVYDRTGAELASAICEVVM